MEEKKLFPFDHEYVQEVYRRLKEGGILYLVERTDTHQFLHSMITNYREWGRYDRFKNDTQDVWLNEIPIEMDIIFPNYSTEYIWLTKSDAEKYGPKQWQEGGCVTCKHGSTEIPIKITEHEFVPQ